MGVPETTAAERQLLRRAGQLETRASGKVYINAHSYQHMAKQAEVDSLLGKGLMVRAGSRFERTAVGNQVLAGVGS